MLPLQIKTSVRFLVMPFSRILDHFERFFLNLGPHLESCLLPWRHFWSTLAQFVVLKTRLWRQRCPKSAPRRPPPKSPHVLEPMLGSFFAGVPIFSAKNRFVKYVFVKVRFFVIFGPPKTRPEGFSLESQHDFCIFTFLQKSTKKRPELVPFWDPFSFKFRYFCEKRRSKKCFKKSASQISNNPLLECPEAPGQPPSRARFTEQ